MVACESSMTALQREDPLFTPGFECNFPTAPGDFDRLISGYRIMQTALYRDTALRRPPKWGTPTVVQQYTLRSWRRRARMRDSPTTDNSGGSFQPKITRSPDHHRSP